MTGLKQLASRMLQASRSAGLLVIVAACAPSYPLYAPLQVAGSHGYADSRLGPARFQVSYRAPASVGYALSLAARDADADARLSLAYDMALWRASELSLENGYPAFTIADRANDASVDVRYGYFGDPFYLPCTEPVRIRRLGCYRPYPGAYDHSVIVNARVTLTIDLAPEIRPEVIDAKDAVAKLKARYPTALLAGQPLG